MRSAQFWQKATDIHDIYYNKHQRAILTDDELQGTVTDFINDIINLVGEWYNSQKENKRGEK